MIRLRLLGETAIDVAGVPVGPESQVIFAVLLLLSLERGKRMARTALHRLLWPAADDESGRHNLRQVAYKLRQLGVPLDATQSSLMLPSSAVEGELVELLSGSGAVGARLLAGRRVGELLPGYAPTFSSPFADWVDEQRGLLQSGLRRALLSAMAEARQSGRWREVEAIAREVLRFDPLNEEATLALAEATALAGSKAQAIDIIDRYLGEMGRERSSLQIPANVLRRRIAERFPVHKYVTAADRCFVGRASEMATVLRAWHQAKDGHGGAVMLWGEPGIGKTRLADELAKVAVLQGGQVQCATSRSWDVARPLGAIIDLVPGVRQLPGAAGIDPRCNDYLNRLAGHEVARPLTDDVDPTTLHGLVRQAVLDLIDAVLVESPLVLVLEDVQWLDPASWEVIGELLRRCRMRRLLLVLTSRDAHPLSMPSSEDWEALLRLRIRGIDDSAAGQLLDAMTREAGRYMEVDHREWCLPLAGGNPLFVQEVALQWLEKGNVRTAPTSLRAMIEARIARLNSGAGTLLQVLALAERPLRTDWLSELRLLDLKTTVSSLADLSGFRLIECHEAHVRIRHPVITEIVVGQIEPASRALLHNAIASALESIGDASAIWEAAYHWSKGDPDPAAYASMLRCARHLVQLGLFADATKLYDLAGQTGAGARDRTQLLMLKSLALAYQDRWQQVTELLNESAIADDPQHNHSATLAMLCLLEARWRRQADLNPSIREALALAAAPTCTPDVRVKAATLGLVLIDNRDGDISEYSVHTTTLDALLALPSVPPVERHRHLMVRRLLAGDPLGAADCARRMLAKLDSAARPFDCIIPRQAAYAFRTAGQLNEAEAALQLALDRANTEGRTLSAAESCVALAVLQLYRHEAEAAGEWLERALAVLPAGENLLATHALFTTRAQLAATLGQTEQLRAITDSLPQSLPTRNNSRLEMAMLSLLLRAELAGADILSPDGEMRLARLVELVTRHQHRGSMDFALSSCARALLATKREGAANRMLARYLATHRIDRCALHLDLQRLIAQKGQTPQA